MAVLSVGFPRVAAVVAAVWLFALPAARAGGHSCEAEIASACPDSPASELAACLQDSSVHEQETTISSECTDFVAVNTACKDDVEKLCDDAFFSDDTLPCLTQWVQPEDLSSKCRGVLAWAAPAAEEEEDEEGPTDELGMSEKDKQEKKEWMEKRRAGRGDAIERMKMQEVDRKKEEDRVELLKFKEENPEEYAEMIKQQEEEEKAVAAQKRKERQMQAAYLLQKQDAEKARRREAGEDVDEDRPKKAPKVSRAPKAKEGTSAMTALFCVFFLLAVCAVGLYVAKTVTADADDLVSNTKQDKREKKENKENKKKNKRA